MGQKMRFQKALPIWALKRANEMNCELAFRMLWNQGAEQYNTDSEVILALAASTIYRVWINGEFVAAGPARAAHGFYRVDELNLTKQLTQEENVIVIEVVGYNVNSYDTLDQPSFLTAELLQNGVPVSYTGDEKVKIYDLHQRIQRVQRYSFQRAFVDCYSLSAAKQSFYTEQGSDSKWEQLGINQQMCEIQQEKRYITRDVNMPHFEKLNVEKLIEVGTADFGYVCPNPVRDRSYLNISDMLKGFPPEELEEHLSDEGQNIAWIPDDKAYVLNLEEEKFPLKLSNGYGMYHFPYNATGFLRFIVEVTLPCVCYVMFDEILRDGQLDFLRGNTCNCLKYKLDVGTHQIITFAPYVMKYVKLVVHGSCVISQMDMIEYKHAQTPQMLEFMQQESMEDDTLKQIYLGALESYRSNALDVFMDCPSRERAGWLCDSFFTARVEHVLTGETKIEKAFLDNFLMAEEFPHLPKGMLPMCYPADHNDGLFIPNWAMWFVLELEEYLGRSGDSELIQRAKKRVYDLLDYFKPFENEFGLLENLESWVFVEWSRANAADVVQDVNYPSNMLYAKMLRVVARLYDDSSLLIKSDKLRKVIRERSFQNGYYTDNERRTEKGLINPGNCTEVCQYYAFFTGIATKEEDGELWEVLLKDFGPQRKETKLHLEVAYANAFIGNYLRLELLYQDKKYDELMENIRGYFENMARQTGTLWENDTPIASCNHGFASHVIYWLRMHR